MAEAAGAARGHLVTPDQEPPHTIIDVVVNRPVRHQARPIAWGWKVSPQARFLKRQLSLPVSMISQWCVRRSSSAVVILASLKTLGHSPKARLVVTMIEVRS